MKEDAARPQINASKLVIRGGIIGAIFAGGSMSIFLIGIPILRVMFPAAIVLGVVVALILHFKRHETPGAPWIIAATEKKTGVPSGREHTEDTGRFYNGFSTVLPPVDLSAATS
jgi:branched-subunit amino acid permease